MGGHGSGRSGGRPTSEACGSYVLNAQLLTKARLRDGLRASHVLTYSDGFELTVTVDTTNPDYRFLELEHVWHTYGEARTERYRVMLATTRPPFGGVRWWFECPRTLRSVTKLYLPLGGRRFLSRQAYRLGYACQREDRLGRVERQSRKLYRRLGGDGNWLDGPPAKPKWMRWRTYDRALERYDALSEKRDRVWLAGAQALLARLDRHRRR